VKGLGNYRFPPQVERRLGTLVQYRGGKAVVRFHNGMTYALPAEPLKKVGVEADGKFVIIITRVGGDVAEIRVEQPSEARPALPRRLTPKVVVKTGRKLITRKK
jgi:hypothetical protein